MDEDIFDMSDPEMVALAKEAQGQTIPVSYITITPPAPVQAPQAPIVNENKQKYEQAPWLLSTRRTLAKAGIKYYEGYDFTFNRDKGRRVSGKNIYAVFTAMFHNTIIPNAIIAERAGFAVDLKRDVYPAIKYAMRHRKMGDTEKNWESVAQTGTWAEDNIRDPLNFYAKGIRKTVAGESVIPAEERISLEDYVKNQISKYKPNLKYMKFGKSPKLNMLIEAFTHEREIADMSYQELMERFKVSRGTVSEFKKWVKGRRESGKEDGQSFVITR